MKKDLLRLKSYPGVIPKRSDILGGAIKTYFWDQNPVIDGTVIMTGDSHSVNDKDVPLLGASYSSPRTWVPAGSLIRTPQVVYLSSSVPTLSTYKDGFPTSDQLNFIPDPPGPTVDPYHHGNVVTSAIPIKGKPNTGAGDVFVGDAANYTHTIDENGIGIRLLGLSPDGSLWYLTGSGGVFHSVVTLASSFSQTGQVVVSIYNGTTTITDNSCEASFSIPNAWQTENSKRLAIFDEVLSTMSTLRGNRTLVKIVDWMGRDSLNSNYYCGNRLTTVLAPDSEKGDFLGVDFYHLFFGNPAIDNSSSRKRTVVNWLEHSGQPGFLDSQSQWFDCINRIQRSFDGFGRYRVDLFSYSLDWPDPDFIGKKIADYSGVQDIHDHEHFVLYDQFGNVISDITFNRDFTFSISQDGGGTAISEMEGLIKSGFQLVDTASADACSRIAEFFNHYGFSYLGDGTSVTASDIVSMIADHFEFDPATGKDL